MGALVPVAALAAVLPLSSLTAQEIHPEELELKPRIDAAIAAGIETLLDEQLRDGSWGVHGDQVGGQTALCAYALLKCGVPLDHPALQRAFGFLDHVTPTKTYATGCMLLAYGATGQAHHRQRMGELLDILLGCQHRHGTWAYPQNAPDLSNTQYAALGLWAAAQVELEVPPEAWQNLIRGTLAHQEAYRAEEVGITGRTGVGRREVAGFQYRAHKSKVENNATGSMTTAGVSILKICEIGLGSRLRGGDRKELTRAMDAGLAWLEVNFSVDHDQKPGKGGRWLLYYLYGMERVGGLTRLERFGEHWWYVQGARRVLDRQKNGGWGKPHDTCFALLFLRRATIAAPVTGGGVGNSSHLFAAGNPGDDIQLRGAGQQPVMLYIAGFGQRLLGRHAEHGLRVLRVEYLEGDRVLGQLAGDPTKAWTELDTFVHRCPPLSHGVHTLWARVIAVDPAVPPGEVSPTVTVGSKPMDVRIRDVIEPWMQELAQMQSGNELKGAEFDVTASSRSEAAAKAADGLTHTHWLCEPEDPEPTLTFAFPDGVPGRWLILTQPFQRREDLDRIGLIRQVEVAWNGKRPITVDLHPNPLAPTEIELPRARRVRSLTVRVVGRDGKPGLPVGFAEVVLEDRRR